MSRVGDGGPPAWTRRSAVDGPILWCVLGGGKHRQGRSWRVASLTAEPTPTRDKGSTSVIDFVAGVEISPIPPRP